MDLRAEIHLDAMGLDDTIKHENNASLQDRAKAMIFLHRHIHEGLKNEYHCQRPTSLEQFERAL